MDHVDLIERNLCLYLADGKLTEAVVVSHFNLFIENPWNEMELMVYAITV